MSTCAYCGSQLLSGYSSCPQCRRPVPREAQAQGKSRSMSTGLILVFVAGGLVVLVAFLGIVAALLIPNFLDALQKAKQKRTTADIRNLGTAVVSYWSDKGYYPMPENLASALVPDYIPQIPTQDGWKHPLQYVCAEERYNATACESFFLASAGRDGVYEHDDLTAYEEGTFGPTDYDADIVFRDGGYVRGPATAGNPP